jgi:phospholipase C
LLVIVYDEHGGFFDHVQPPAAEDDDPSMRRYGVRVPALLVSPLATAGVCSTVFDHTSVLRSILDRFQPDLDRDVMGRRVAAASNLSSALGVRAAPPQPMPKGPMPAAEAVPGQSPQGIANLIRSSQDGLSMARILQRQVSEESPDGRPLDDLQAGLIVAAGELSHMNAGPSQQDLTRAGITS